MNRDLLDVDPELAGLFPGEPDLLDLARRAREGRPEAPPAPVFQAYLRARLMDAAPQHLRRRGGLRELLLGHRGRTGLALVAAGVGAAMITVGLTASLHRGGGSHVSYAVLASSDLQGKTTVDPNDTIHIAFTEAMDRGSVVRAVHIQPATSFTAAWSGDTLTIAPTNHLAASTAYRVTIDPSVARAADPTVALAHPIVVTFGTRPTPPPAPSPPPAPAPLSLGVVGAADPGSILGVLPDGTVLADGPQPAAAATPAAATPAASTGSPPATPGAPSPTAAVAGSPVLLRLGSGAPRALGAAAGALAVAPGGRSVAALLAAPGGSGRVVVIAGDGSAAPRTLTTHVAAGSPLAWQQRSTVVFVGDGGLRSVDLQGTVRNLADGVAVTAGDAVTLAPDGLHAVVRQPSGAALLVDLGGSGRAPQTLPGSLAIAAFSGDGARLGWVDSSGPLPQLRVVDLAGAGAGAGAATAGPATATPSATAGSPSATPRTLTVGDVRSVDALALSGDGASAALAVTRSDGGGELRILALPGGAVAGVAPGNFGHPAFDAAGHLLAVRRGGGGGEVVRAALPGGAAPAAAAIPAAAESLLSRLVSAQSGSGDLDAIPVSGSPGPALRGLTPAGITQAYVVAETRAGSGDDVTAQVRLVRVPDDASTPVRFADEHVTVTRAAPADAYRVAALSVGPLLDAPGGPHVTHVELAGTPGARLLLVSFDSDIDPGSLAGAIGAGAADGSPLAGAASYDAARRTATVALSGAGSAAGQQLTVSVATRLRDIDGNALATAYSATLSG